MNLLIAIAIVALLAVIFVQSQHAEDSERRLREQQLRIESLEETNKAMRVKPSRWEGHA